jgi:hypothetical protein
MPRRCPEFEPGEAGVETAKLEKFSDADGSQIQWLEQALTEIFTIAKMAIIFDAF